MRPTSLQVRHNDEEDDDDDGNDLCGTTTKPLHLLLHSESTPCRLNDYLKQHPQLAKRARALKRLSTITTQTITNTNTITTTPTSTTTTTGQQRKVINVLQAEVAHATAHQVDWMVSGDATTCHIVGVRSTSTTTTSSTSCPNQTTPTRSHHRRHEHDRRTVVHQHRLGPCTTLNALTSLAHLDECHLPSLDAIVQEHLRFHHYHEQSRQQPPQQQPQQEGGTRIKEEDDTSDDEDFGFFFDAVEELNDLEHDDGENWMHPAVPHKATTTRTNPSLPPLTSSYTMSSTSPTELQHFPGFASSRRFHATTPISDDDRHNNHNCVNKANHGKIQMELHLVGGCDDPTSYQLSRDLLEAWATLADHYSSQIQIHLVTAAISSLNVKDSMTPKDKMSSSRLLSRGMGIDCHTGQVFGLQSIATELQGPAIEVRQARLWARAATNQQQRAGSEEKYELETNRLAVIHTPQSAELNIAPFEYWPHPHLEVLLQMPNDVLKKVTSTSPELEGDHFCTSMRRTLSWLQLVPSDTVFGKQHQTRPLRYSRSAVDVHQWEPHDAGTRHAVHTSQSALEIK